MTDIRKNPNQELFENMKDIDDTNSDIEETDTDIEESEDYRNLPYIMRDLSNHVKTLSFHSKKMMTHRQEPFCESDMMTFINDLVRVVNKYHQNKEKDPSRTRKEKNLFDEWSGYTEKDSFPIKEKEVREYWDQINRQSGKSGIPISSDLQQTFLKDQEDDDDPIDSVYVGQLKKDVNSLNKKLKKSESDRQELKRLKTGKDLLEKQLDGIRVRGDQLQSENQVLKEQVKKLESKGGGGLSSDEYYYEKQNKVLRLNEECNMDQIDELEQKIEELQKQIQEESKG